MSLTAAEEVIMSANTRPRGDNISIASGRSRERRWRVKAGLPGGSGDKEIDVLLCFRGFLLVVCSPEVITLLSELIELACQISSLFIEYICLWRESDGVIVVWLMDASLKKCENESTAASA